jgi:hypothetical protein
MMAFSRLAKLMSQVSVISLPLPVARPRMTAMEATGKRVKRTRKSGQGAKAVGPGGSAVRSSRLGHEIGMIQEVVVDRLDSCSASTFSGYDHFSKRVCSDRIAVLSYGAAT